MIRDPDKLRAAKDRARERERAKRLALGPKPEDGLLPLRPMPTAISPWAEWEWIDSGRRMRRD